MTPNYDSLLNKIKNLLSLAENNSNVHEADNAMQKAQALLQEYNLSLSAVQGFTTDNDGITEEMIYNGGKNNTQWELSLANVVAMNNFCKVISFRKTGYKIYGKSTDIELVVYMINNYNSQLQRIYKTQILPKKHPSAHGKSYANSFYIGAVSGLADKLDQGKKEFESKPGGTELIIYNENAISDYIEDSGIKTTHAHSSYKRNHSAYEDGYKIGSNLELNNSLNKQANYYLGSGK